MLATVEKLDPATGVWTRKADLPQAAYGVGLGVFGCTTEDGGRCKLLAVGGYAAGEARNPRAPPPCTAVPSVCLHPRAPGPAPDVHARRSCNPVHSTSSSPAHDASPRTNPPRTPSL